jgi:hypothetical protein
MSPPLVPPGLTAWHRSLLAEPTWIAPLRLASFRSKHPTFSDQILFLMLLLGAD